MTGRGRRSSPRQALQADLGFDVPVAAAGPVSVLSLSLSQLDHLLGEIEAGASLADVRLSTRHLLDAVRDRALAPAGLFVPAGPDDTVSIRGDLLDAQLRQIVEALTVERTHYYARRLRRSLIAEKTSALNDLNLARWQEYDDIQTDSLWLIDRRDRAGVHLGSYWGNFVPQIPRQLMRRYTRRGEWVLDGFSGSGTTLIECRRLGRHGLGVELSPPVATASRALIELEPGLEAVTTCVVDGDSRTLDLRAVAAEHGVETVQLVILHPPYHDIIKFSDDGRDLSNAPSVEAFLEMFGAAVENTGQLLERGRMLAVVIGDKFARGEWVPLGFRCLEEVAKRGYLLKSIVVKNFEETTGKRRQQALWRYRALAGGFFVFKHEYVLIFQKR